MSFLASAWGRGLTGAAAVFACCSLGWAQGFSVRLLNISSEQVNDHTEAMQFLGDPRTDPKDFEASFDGSANYVTVNFGGGNNFGGDEQFPDGGPNDDSREDYIMSAVAELDFSNATSDFFAIGFGTDDGGQLTLEGVEMIDFINTNDGGELPYDFDQIAYNGNRGHGWTYSSFEAPAGKVNFNASMHERGGGDSWEVAIIPLEDDLAPEAFNVGDGWQLLQDGVFGINVVSEGKGLIKIGGDDLGELFVDGRINVTRDPPSGDFEPGLAQEWSSSGNAGNRDGIINARITNGIDPAPFRAEDTDWWSGSATLDTTPKYPADIEAAGYAVGDGANNDQYSVVLSGQLRFEENGTYKFRDGVDDYTYLAIDKDRSGVAGDSDGEVLIDDNAWVGVDAVRNGTEGDNPSPLAEIEIDGVTDADSQWVDVEFMMAEGGGGDAGVLFWNGVDRDNALFDDPGLVIDDPSVLVPQSHTRSKIPGAITGVSVSAEAQGGLNDYEMQVSSRLLDSDHILVNAPDGAETILDVGDITVNVVADGELVTGDEWVLFGATSVVGLDTVTLNFDDPAQWDTSNLGVNGRIKFLGANVAGDCNGDGVVDAADFACGYRPELAGDLNADGSVGFADFLVLSANFGQEVVGYGDGDITGDGSVSFEDFLSLSDNFGRSTGGVAAVPEPSSVALLGLGGLLFGLVRRRRK